jgi:hypothetical protein
MRAGEALGFDIRSIVLSENSVRPASDAIPRWSEKR